MTQNQNPEIQSLDPISDQFIWQANRKNGIGTIDVPIDVVYHPDLREGHDFVQLLPGYGEEMKSAAAGVRKLGKLELVGAAVIYPFDEAKIPDIDHWWIRKILTEVPLFAAQELNKVAGNMDDEPMEGIGSSQGVGLIMAASRNPEAFSTVELKAPFGLTNGELGENENERIFTFVRRMLINAGMRWDQSPLRDPRNLLAGLEVGRRVAIDLAQDHLSKRNRFGTKIGYAVMTDDALKALDNVARIKGKADDIRVWVGEKDPLVQEDEVKNALSARGLSNLVHTYLGSHAGLRAKGSLRQLQPIAAHIHERRRARAEARLRVS